MWYPAEISLSSYLPAELEEGMLFINRISVGVIEPYIELFELLDRNIWNYKEDVSDLSNLECALHDLAPDPAQKVL